MPETVQEKINALREAIESFEKQRAALGSVVVDTAIQALEKQIAELQPEQQRKQATILMMDIAGHTSIVRDLDPEENMEIIDRALILLEKPVVQAGGRVTRFTGDGFKAIFGHPESHDNDPEMAVRAGLEILYLAKKYSLDLEEKRGIKGFEVRIGIDSGIVLIGGISEGEDTVKGEAVNLASRLETVAPPGGLLISANTERLVHGNFELQKLLSLELKGFNEPITAFLVTGARAESFIDRTRGVDWVRTPLIGREDQLAHLDSALQRVNDRKQAQLVTVIADAGVGKSRLMLEFEGRLPEGTKIFKGRSQREHQLTPYSVFRNMFSRHLGIQENFPADRLPEKFEAEIAPWLADGEDGKVRSHFIGNLLGFDFSKSRYLEGVAEDVQQLSDRAWGDLITFFTNIANKHLCILLIEDIHWADAQSLDALVHLVHVLDKQQMLIVCNARPALFEQREQWGKTHPAFQTLRLPPLSRRDSRLLIGKILARADHIPLILREFIVSGAEGNPFYIEELIKMLIENGVINKTDSGWQIEQNRLLDLDVPPTLTGVIQSRLDSLSPFEKSLLQQASVVGRNFWDGILLHINSSETDVSEQSRIHDALRTLQDKEMIYAKKKGAFTGFQEYVFKHAILREVTYETVLKRMRPVYHGLIAEWLIEHGAEKTSEFTPIIAGHLELGGQLERAAVYLRIAGEQSMKQYVNNEALRYLGRALELLPENDLLERFLVLKARTQIFSLQGNRTAQKMDIFSLEEIARALDDDERRGQVALLHAVFSSELSEYDNIIRYSKQAIEFGQSAGSARIVGQGHQLWGRALIAQGEYKEAEAHLEKAIEIARPSGLSQIEADSIRYMGIVAERLETTEAALDRYQQSLAIYRRIGDLRGEGWVLKDLGNLKLRSQDLYDEGIEHLNSFHEITEKIGDLQGKGSSFHMLAEISRRKGDFSTASELLSKALRISDKTGNETIEIESLFEFGIIAIEKSEFAEAGRHFSKVLELAKSIGNKPTEAKSLLQIGRLFHRQGDYVRAMKYYQQSLSLFKELGNRKILAQTLAYIGLLNNHLNNHNEALQNIEQALEILNPLDYTQEKAFVLTQFGHAKLAAGSMSEALEAFEQAYRLYSSTEERNRALEPFAGQAEVYLRSGKLNKAVSIAEKILESVQSSKTLNGDNNQNGQGVLHGLEGTTDPVSIYFTCCRALMAVDDLRADVMLEKLVKILNTQVARIEEVDLKQAFLNIPVHQSILEVHRARKHSESSA